MGTLGCINDMLQRNKENRELRKISSERLKDVRKRLIDIDHTSRLPAASVEELEEIKLKTVEKQEAERDHFFKVKMLFFGLALVIVFLGWLLYSFFAAG